MKKRILFLLAILYILHLFSACTSTPDPTDQMLAMVDEMEEALGDEWSKQYVTKVLQYEMSSADGEVYTFYFCLTTYYDGDPNEVTGLDLKALSAVFPPEEYTLYKEWLIEGYSTGIYQSPERSFLCWTSSPEVTGIIEYVTGTLSDEDAYRIVRSVYIPPDSDS